LIVNVNGSTVEEYIEVTEKSMNLKKVAAMELNISCPNVKEGGMAFGVSCPSAEYVTREVRKAYDKTLIVKLSPNVTDVTEIARAVEAQGADSVSLVNTFLGMAVDSKHVNHYFQPLPEDFPDRQLNLLPFVWYGRFLKAVKIPVIGMGGIMNAADAIEFFLVGASAVQVGTAIFKDPLIPLKIIDGIENYLNKHGLHDVSEIIGGLQM
jgi:dihydroorotate dehydrogenase (NAD+) catalytic subunit